jgi:3-oxoacyl-[acyl-carrier protein] reductase
MAFDFTGSKAIVTGGSRGIGRAIALALAKAGASVSICARGAEALAATEADLREIGGKIHAARCDLSQASEIGNYVEAAAKALGGIDILVSNATGFEMAGDMWANCLAVDLMSAVRAADLALPFLEKSKAGAIVNISSISALKPATSEPAYAAAKAALIQYTTSQALNLAPKRIRVNCVAPGSVEFPGGFWARCKTDDSKTYRAVEARIPFGRYGTVDEIANVVLFLASPLSSWITGQTIVVDGGQVLKG